MSCTILYYILSLCLHVLSMGLNPIRSGLFQTANDPGGPPPPTISKTIVSIFTISYMCILPRVLGMFHLKIFKNCDFDYFTAISK